MIAARLALCLAFSSITAAAEAQRATLEQRVTRLENRVLKVETRLSQLESQKRTWVQLDATSRTGYERIDTDFGSLFLTVKDAAPYVDGYKVTLWIGNPLSAGGSKLQIHANWGPKQPAADASLEVLQRWVASLREKEFTFPQDLPPGRWTPVELVLSPATAEEIRYLSVRVSVSTVSLNIPTY